jgi:CHASE3 domain sensor protein
MITLLLILVGVIICGILSLFLATLLDNNKNHQSHFEEDKAFLSNAYFKATSGILRETTHQRNSDHINWY